MFRLFFIKLFALTVCIWVINVTCLLGQRVGIIDVVTKQVSEETHELTIRTHSENEIRVSLIQSDDTLYLEKLITPPEVLTNILPSGIYQLIVTDCHTEGQTSYLLCLED